MKKFLVLFLVTFIIPIGVNAYELKNESQIGWGGSAVDKINKYVETSDGNIVLAGTSTSTDIEGLSNNGKEDIVLIKYDKDGNLLWQKNWGGNKEEYIYGIVATSDGGIVIIGECYSTNIDGITNKGGGDCLILKLDKDGNEVWKHNWGGNKEDYFFNITMVDDGFIVCGYFRSTEGEGLVNKGDQDIIVNKYDFDGNMMWQIHWGGEQNDTLSAPLVTKDGSLIFVGNSSSTNIEGLTNKGKQDAVIVKYDKNGNLIWQKNWGGDNYDWFNSSALAEDGHVVLLASSSSTDLTGFEINGASDFLILKYDQDGNLIWQKNWGGNDSETGRKIFYIENEGYIIFGQSTSTDIEGITNKGKGDFIFFKMDLNGNVVWKKGWGGNGLDQISAVIEIEDGKYIICGNSWSTDIEDIDNERFIDTIWLTCDKNGNIFEKYAWYDERKATVSPTHITKNGDILALGTFYNINIDDIQNKGSADTLIIKYKPSYDISINESENGIATVLKSGKIGIITPKPDKGYTVDKIIIKDTNGKEIQTTVNENGTYTFNVLDDVSIDVLFKIINNPKTGDVISYIEFILLILLLVIVTFIRGKQLRKS